MDGGALLGQGAYGCIFDHPLQCETPVKTKHHKNEEIVGKLSEAVDVTNEIYASKVLSDIAKANDYYVLADLKSICWNPAPLDKEKDKAGLAKCEVIKKYGNANMIHYTMPYGGISIHQHFDKIVPKTFPARMMITHFLEGCALMALNGFVHYDLHTGNVLLEATTHIPKIIDFGFSFSSHEISQKILDERWKVYTPGPQGVGEPPEITIITGIRKGFNYKSVLRDVSQKKRPLKNVEQYFGLSRYRQLRDFDEFWKSSQAAQKKDWVAFFRMYWPAFDAWGAGFIILHIYMQALNVKELQDSDDWSLLSSQLKEILRGLLRMDPRKRMDCVEALAVISPESAVVSSLSGRAWLEQKETSRQALREP